MKLAILFWFYKETEICENRLQILKKYNPDLKIYGLFGGEQSEAEEYKNRLGKYLDDFYISPFSDSDWKWINGDLMILDWYEKRGKNLDWDSVAVVQWDMLVFDSLADQFKDMKKGEIFISGLRPLNEEIEEKWDWVKIGGEERKNYLKFLEYIKNQYGYIGETLCSLFIFEIFPREFLEKYATIENKEIGMLEYKVPMYAKILEIPFFEKDLGVWWFEPEGSTKPLNAVPKEIERVYVEAELKKKEGFRIFHPYFQKWKL
jgi:hypothetical protein